MSRSRRAMSSRTARMEAAHEPAARSCAGAAPPKAETTQAANAACLTSAVSGRLCLMAGRARDKGTAKANIWPVAVFRFPIKFQQSQQHASAEGNDQSLKDPR